MAKSTKRQMALVGFMQAGNATVYAGSWRHPATEHGFLTAGYYEKLARTLEQGCFDLMFFDDRLAMPGIYGGSVAEAVRTGARPVKLDLSIVLGIVAAWTGGYALTAIEGAGKKYAGNFHAVFALLIGGLAVVISGCMLVTLFLWRFVPAAYTA